MFEETLRIDPSSHFVGLRLNFWVSLVVFVGSAGFFVWWQFLRDPAAPKRRGSAAGAAGEARAGEEAGPADGRAEGPRPVGRVRSCA